MSTTSTIITVVFQVVAATVIAFIAYRTGRREATDLWHHQCDALVEGIQDHQMITHGPMVNGDAVISVLNQFRAGGIHSVSYYAPDPFADSPFNAEMIRPGDPGYDILDQARREGHAEGEL